MLIIEKKSLLGGDQINKKEKQYWDNKFKLLVSNLFIIGAMLSINMTWGLIIMAILWLVISFFTIEKKGE